MSGHLIFFREEPDLPTLFSGLDFSVAFRPSPAPSERCASIISEQFNESPSLEILRIQPYLKYPGFDLPELVITEKTKDLAIALRTDRDLSNPGSPQSPLLPHEMPYNVSLQVEGIFCAAIGVLYSNKSIKSNRPLMWQKVQRVLAARDEAWKSRVTSRQIYELVTIYAKARVRFLDGGPKHKMSSVSDNKYWRLMKTVDRWIALSKDKASVSNDLRFRAKAKWIKGYIIRSNPLTDAPAKNQTRMMTPADSDTMDVDD
ncbi:hypothetical protein EsH8_X_000376 [Colletotrichum jinshuiense]